MDSMPPYITPPTMLACNELLATANQLSFPLGKCMGRPSNGDCVWFILTHDDAPLHNLYIIVITPHCLLAEYKIGGRRSFSIIDEPVTMLGKLKRVGYRSLSSSEYDIFTAGSGESDSP